MLNYEINDDGLETVSDIMTEYTEQVTDKEEQKQAYQEYLQLDEDSADELTEVEQTSAVSEEFDSIPDGELENLYEQILDKDDGQRTDEETALLEQTKERYLKIKFYREFEDAARWFETEYPENDFEKIVNDSNFLEFAAGIKLPVRELIRRYVSMNDRYEKNQNFVSTGSVRTNGATVEKDYFSPAEVDRMSEEEVSKNLETIKKSMRKWK